MIVVILIIALAVGGCGSKMVTDPGGSPADTTQVDK